jgi:hypothetical protein
VRPVSTPDDGLYRGDPPPASQPPAGWAPPGYAPPQYVPPQYAPPAYGYPPPGFYRPPTNTMAVLSLVFAFLMAPVGIVLGVMARKQIRQTGEEGEGLALAGIIVGSIATAFWALLIVFWIIVFATFTGSLN